jgi:hypothetical protein
MRRAVLMMLGLTVLLAAMGMAAAPGLESRAHERVREVMRANGGRALFSDLYNSAEVTPDERDYLARLYEVFFALPEFLESESASTGRIPSRRALATTSG